MPNHVTEQELALAAKAGFTKMGSAPIWPTTRGNLLGYIHGQRKSLKICSKHWQSDIEWSIRSAQLCLARLRKARSEMARVAKFEGHDADGMAVYSGVQL